MKRAILIIVAVTTMTGVAGAQMLRPAASPVTGASSATPALAQAETPPPIKQDAPTPRHAPTLLVRQAPVPMQLAPRVPVVIREAPTPDASNAAQESSRPETPADAVLSDAAVRAAVEADGYKRVRVIKAENGMWRAVALRGNTEVALRVDAQGNVTTE